MVKKVKLTLSVINDILKKLKKQDKSVRVSGNKKDKIKQLVKAVNDGDADMAKIIRKGISPYKGDENADKILAKLGGRGKSPSPKKKTPSPKKTVYKKKKKTPSPIQAGSSNSFTLNGNVYTYHKKGNKTTIKNASGKSVNSKTLTAQLKEAIARDCDGRTLKKSVKNNSLRVDAARNVAQGCDDDALFEGEINRRSSPSPRRSSPSPRRSSSGYGDDHCVNTGCNDTQTCDLDTGGCVDGNYKTYKAGRPTLKKAALNKLARQHKVDPDALKFHVGDDSRKFVGKNQEVIDTFRRYLEESRSVKRQGGVERGPIDSLLVEYQMTGADDYETMRTAVNQAIESGDSETIEFLMKEMRDAITTESVVSPVRKGKTVIDDLNIRSPTPEKRNIDEDIAAAFARCLSENMN